VQGVGFRWSAKREADRLGVAGWVRNLPDGRVEAAIEGNPDALRRMLAWLGKGPPGAVVERVEATARPPEGRRGFEIRG
jgi:acylphosphatase